MSNPFKLLDIQEASEALHISKHTLYRYVSRHEIPFVKIGSRVVFKPQDIEDFVEQRRVVN